MPFDPVSIEATEMVFAVNTGDMIQGVSVFDAGFVDMEMKVIYTLLTEGSTSKTLSVKLRRNALVRTFDVVVTAANAAQVAAGVAGQIRTTSKGGGKTSVVVDFGALRTITAVSLPTGVKANNFAAWAGTKFNFPTDVTPATFFRLPSEVRTERFEVEVTGSVNSAALATDMFFVMPDLPAGLELRIDDGPPVFTHPAPVQPGTEAAVTDSGWNSDSSRIVHLADAMAKLTGNPEKDDEVTFKLTLTSLSPGLLDLTESSRDLRYIRKAKFDGAVEKDLEFETEGRVTFPLDSLPQNLGVEEVRWTAIATIPPTRVLPAVGPDANGVAEIRIAPERALVVRLDPATPLGKLTGLRIPLRVGASGAEARIVLWTNKPGANQPLAEIDAATSDPASLSKSDAEQWITFSWTQPVAIPPDGMWAAVNVESRRGLFAFAALSVDSAWATALWGSPSGPWRDSQTLAGQRARVHMMGTAKSGVKIDPYQLALGSGNGAGSTPNPKGVANVLKLSPAVVQTGVANLVVTSYVAARLKLRDVEVVSTN